MARHGFERLGRVLGRQTGLKDSEAAIFAVPPQGLLVLSGFPHPVAPMNALRIRFPARFDRAVPGWPMHNFDGNFK